MKSHHRLSGQWFFPSNGWATSIYKFTPWNYCDCEIKTHDIFRRDKSLWVFRVFIIHFIQDLLSVSPASSLLFRTPSKFTAKSRILSVKVKEWPLRMLERFERLEELQSSSSVLCIYVDRIQMWI